MKNFADRLVRRIAELDNPTVMGLDPKLDYIPAHLIEEAKAEFPDDREKATAHAIWLFNKALIDAVYDIVPAIKPQFAYYELYGIEALKVLDKTVKYAQEKGLETAAWTVDIPVFSDILSLFGIKYITTNRIYP